jgi:hypothetical protein
MFQFKNLVSAFNQSGTSEEDTSNKIRRGQAAVRSFMGSKCNYKNKQICFSIKEPVAELWTTSKDTRRIFLTEMGFWRKFFVKSGIREGAEERKL